MNYAGFTRPLWSWLCSPESELTYPGMPVPFRRRDGAAVVSTMREFAARVSWRSRLHSWNLLSSHDTPRIRTITGDPALVEVGAGLLLTMPGTPMILAGDEIGIQGTNGEDGRRPMPWQRQSTWDARTLAAYRELVALRRANPALRTGGLRWAHVAADALAYWRETADARLLVLARRAPGAPVPLPEPVRATNLYGGAALSGALPGDGPTFQVWAVD
ncbi:MAG: DUF3459 domain-containing protein, partial [Micromonosporaceae bacterium]|nr:DUF3459 domain-containing protein [Micromonosporaceae bacterium]